MRAALAVAVLLLAVPEALAAEPPRTVRLISTSGGNVTAQASGISDDGTRAFISTRETLPGAGDSDGGTDIYERRPDGALRLISWSGTSEDVAFRGMSRDGTSVFFTTAEPNPGLGDDDTSQDVYERRSNGTLHLVSTGGANVSVSWNRASADGSTAVFSTSEPLLDADDDLADDLYARDRDGTLRLISTDGADDEDAFLEGISPDGDRIYFYTGEPVPEAGDHESFTDVFERRRDGTLRLLSTNSTAPDATSAFSIEHTPDGSHVVFHTEQALVAADEDNETDAYDRRADGSLHLVTPGTADISSRVRAISEDGARMVIETREPLAGTGDADAASDVFLREEDGTLTLLSTGTTLDAFYEDATRDLATVFFRAPDDIPGTGDTDGYYDVFARRPDGRIVLIGANGTDQEPNLGAFSPDASRVVFSTLDPLVDADANSVDDYYEQLASGEVRLLSAGSGESAAGGLRVTPDTSRVLFHTAVGIPGTGDADAAIDVYESAWAVPAFTSPAALGGTGPYTCTPGAVTGEGVTLGIEWLLDGGLAGSGSTFAPGAGSRLACRVTATNPIGSATQTSPELQLPVPAADATPPVVTIRRCARRCRRVRGTATDAGGVARVELNVVRKRGKRCFAFTGKRFKKRSCKKARRRFVAAKVAGERWSVRLRKVRRGRHTFRVRAVDTAGNASAVVARRSRIR